MKQIMLIEKRIFFSETVIHFVVQVLNNDFLVMIFIFFFFNHLIYMQCAEKKGKNGFMCVKKNVCHSLQIKIPVHFVP